MGRKDKEWARRRRAQLVQELGGKCTDPKCTTPDAPLEIDHPAGRDYDVRRLSPDQVVRRYLRDQAEGRKLRVLCKVCNSHPRNQPSRRKGEAEDAAGF